MIKTLLKAFAEYPKTVVCFGKQVIIFKKKVKDWLSDDRMGILCVHAMGPLLNDKQLGNILVMLAGHCLKNGQRGKTYSRTWAFNQIELLINFQITCLVLLQHYQGRRYE